MHRRSRHPGLKAVRPRDLVALVWLANAIGAALLFLEYLVIFPFPPEYATEEIIRGNVILGLVAMVLSWVLLLLVVTPRARHALLWTITDSDPDTDQRDLTVGLPWWLFWVQVWIWVASCVAFFIRNLPTGLPLAVQVSGAVMAGGLVTAATSYLLVARHLRPATARVLVLDPPEHGATTGVGDRALFTWVLTTGVPLIGMVTMIAFAGGSDVSRQKLVVGGVGIGLIGLIVGFFATVLFAKAVGEPLRDLSEALDRIQQGDLEVRVAVDDAGEIGRLQAGLNHTVTALREREQLRDLFGRHVGVDVARLAVNQGVALGGEEREVAALFVDVVGSTRLATERPAVMVVSTLNRFFEVVVEVVAEHGGLVNKFEGDAALCIFGAPLELPDAAGAALAAAREIAARLRVEVPELDAGIGVSHGMVIAGNIGSTERLEYTVIGDAVNEAARLTDEAKARPERVVASARTLSRAEEPERARWRLLEPVLLRGRQEPTVPAVPA